jgi:hypothetical protein
MDDLPEYTTDELYYNNKDQLPKTKLFYDISKLMQQFALKYQYVYGLWYRNQMAMLNSVKMSIYDYYEDNYCRPCTSNPNNYTCEMLDADVKILLDSIYNLIGNNKVFIQFKMTTKILSEVYSVEDMIHKYPYLKHFPEFFNNINYFNNGNIYFLNEEDGHINELREIESIREPFKILGPTVFENNNFWKIFNN